MLSLVIHVGPGKCGSSSIQQFFKTEHDPCVDRVLFEHMSPHDIHALNGLQPDERVSKKVSRLLHESADKYDALILSHELFFKCPDSIKNICLLARNTMNNIRIVGYSRRQSDFIVSAYSQWFFRSVARVNEVNEVLEQNLVSPILFTGLERQLIASIFNDFHSSRQLSEDNILDWFSSYAKIINHVNDDTTMFECGVLPDKSSKNALIEDFCKRSGLTLKKSILGVGRNASNTSFNPGIVEAINAAVVEGLDMPGPHEKNDVLTRLSRRAAPTNPQNSDFMSKLTNYVDSYYFKSNTRLCEKFKLKVAYFTPFDHCTKKEILTEIELEGQRRQLHCSDTIRAYRLLSANTMKMLLESREHR